MYKGEYTQHVGGMMVGAGTINTEPCDNCKKIYEEYAKKIEEAKWWWDEIFLYFYLNE